jgi:putative phosphoesterase
MKIGIISDSHDDYANIVRAVDIFNEHQVRYVLHAGDIGSPLAAELFAELDSAEFIGVFGNSDVDRSLLRSTVEKFGGQIHKRSYEGKLDGKHIYMTHKPKHLTDVINNPVYDLVVYGHTHKQDIRDLGSMFVVNPGESTGRFKGPGNVVILNLADMSYEVEALDA